MEGTFVNKVEATGIITLDLMDFKPAEQVVELDIAQFLYLGLMLKEKEFKTAVSQLDWSQYQGLAVAIYCATDAIVPTWAYMFIALYLAPVASHLDFARKEELEWSLWKSNLKQADLSSYENQKVVIRAHPGIDPGLFMLATQLLKDKVKSLFFGEAGLPKVITKN